jgi:hypothetical protein
MNKFKSKSKYSCTLCPKRSFDIFRVSAISINFFNVFVGNSLYWASTACIIFDAHFAYFKFSRVLLVQSLHNVYQAKPWLGFNSIFLPKSNASLTHKILFYSYFHNKQKTYYSTAVKFIHVSFEGWY